MENRYHETVANSQNRQRDENETVIYGVKWILSPSGVPNMSMKPTTASSMYITSHFLVKCGKCYVVDYEMAI